MPTFNLRNAGFVEGILLGLALSGVAVVTLGAARRVRSRSRSLQPSHSVSAPRRVIDGVYPPDQVELELLPQTEASEMPSRLESEAPDVSPLSQRW